VIGHWADLPSVRDDVSIVPGTFDSVRTPVVIDDAAGILEADQVVNSDAEKRFLSTDDIGLSLISIGSRCAGLRARIAILKENLMLKFIQNVYI
jgi:hypothetical protein